MKSFGCVDIKIYEMEFIEMAKSSNKVSLVLKHFKHKWISWKSLFWCGNDNVTGIKWRWQKKLVQNYIQENLQEI
jgi:hypothetical protein